MVDTVRTASFLNSSIFQDGQAAGSITPNDMRDFVVSLVDGAMIAPKATSTVTARSLSARSADVYNVLDFGAFGNGSSHVASSVYGSLGALQAIYGTTISGVTVALTQELDWLATQLAINTATTNGGGVVHSRGSFVYTNANSVSDGSGTLAFPSSGLWAGAVSWQGEFGNSQHTWANDLGTGKFAVLCGGRASASSAGFFAELALTGPGVGSTYGSSSSNMHGIGTNDRRQIKRCNIGGFRAGVNIVGGQWVWEDVDLVSNYYAMYWDTPNANNWGNMEMIRVVAGPSLMASCGVHHAASIDATVFRSCFLGTAPFGIYKETNSGSPTKTDACYQSTFDYCQFENMGNGIICDDTAAPANRVVSVSNTVFNCPEFTWNTSYKVAAKTAYAIFDLASTVGMQLKGISDGAGWLPGTTGIFNINFPGGVIVEGDLAWFFANCVAATGVHTNTMIAGNNGGSSYSTYTFKQTQGSGAPGWTGRAAYLSSAATVGQVLVIGAFGTQVAPSAGNSTEVPLGVCMYTPGVGNWCVMADTGFVEATTSGSPTAGALIRTAASGVGATGGTNSIYGVAIVNTGTNKWAVKLRGLS